ncbi:MAG: AAA family ATPase [Prevotella sp.]|nr:AAA family ATPase [Prevotella sp.]
MKNFEFKATRSQKTSEWMGYTSAPLSVNISINPTRRPSKTFRLRIFNHDKYLLSDTFCEAKKTKKGSKKNGEDANLQMLTFKAESKYIWLPGEYEAILYQVNEPMLHCRFTLDRENCLSSFADMEEYEEGSEEYIVARDLLPSDMFQKLPHDTERSGFKRQLIDLYMRKKASGSPVVAHPLDEIDEDVDDEFTNLYRELRDFFGDEEERKCRNIVVRDIDDNTFVAKVTAIFGLTRMDNLNGIVKRDVWDVRKMMESRTYDIPKAEDVPVVMYGVSGFLDYGEQGRKQMSLFLSMLKQCKECTQRIIMAGGKREIDRLFDAFPELNEVFPEENHLTICKDFDLQSYLYYLLDELRRHNLIVSELVEQRISWKMYNLVKDGKTFGYESVNDIVRYLVSIYEGVEDSEDGDGKELYFESFVVAIDEYLSGVRKEESVEEANGSGIPSVTMGINDCEEMNKLNAMTGLSLVKKEVARMVLMARFHALRSYHNLEEKGFGRNHMLLLGNPGTGKTTVAKLLGEIFHRMGMLSKGHTVVCDRSTLLGQYVGETERKMRDILEKAKGGVLFIDEAYNLAIKDDEKDYGRHVIDALLPVLSDPDPDMIVIFAGYEDKMSALFSLNPGLRDRFTISLHFENYSVDELLSIMKGMATAKHFSFADDALEVLRILIVRTLARRDVNFGNARWAGNLLEHGIIPAMAERILQPSPFTIHPAFSATKVREWDSTALSLITKEDVMEAERTYLRALAPQEKVQKSIGFCA